MSGCKCCNGIRIIAYLSARIGRARGCGYSDPQRKWHKGKISHETWSLCGHRVLVHSTRPGVVPWSGYDQCPLDYGEWTPECTGPAGEIVSESEEYLNAIAGPETYDAARTDLEESEWSFPSLHWVWPNSGESMAVPANDWPLMRGYPPDDTSPDALFERNPSMAYALEFSDSDNPELTGAIIQMRVLFQHRASLVPINIKWDEVSYDITDPFNPAEVGRVERNFEVPKVNEDEWVTMPIPELARSIRWENVRAEIPYRYS